MLLHQGAQIILGGDLRAVHADDAVTTDTSRVVPLPAGQWKLLSDGTSSSLWRGESRTYEREALLMPYSATVFGAV